MLNGSVRGQCLCLRSKLYARTYASEICEVGSSSVNLATLLPDLKKIKPLIGLIENVLHVTHHRAIVLVILNTRKVRISLRVS